MNRERFAWKLIYRYDLVDDVHELLVNDCTAEMMDGHAKALRYWTRGQDG